MKHIIPKAAVILLFISLFLLSGCQLIDFNPSNNGKVDIYLLSSWHKAPDSERIMEEKPIELYMNRWSVMMRSSGMTRRISALN